MTVLAFLLVFAWLAVSAAMMLALSCWALDEDSRRHIDTWRAQDQLSPAASPPAQDREPDGGPGVVPRSSVSTGGGQ